MQNKHTPDIEGIVEELIHDAESYIADYSNKEWFAGRIRTTLQFQADQYEKQKGEMVREMLASSAMAEFTPYDTARAVRIEDIETIAQKYGVDLSE